jgi:hypothetical protein
LTASTSSDSRDGPCWCGERFTMSMRTQPSFEERFDPQPGIIAK